ncbi:TPA: AAA family ATPase [Streptococcus equi subsp. zooepidemicus]|nr:AAA family ATPase [Streptococcus equi subsp. zooepidemicus]
MRFNVVKSTTEIINDNEIYLIHTAWDDWFQYNTKYRVYLKQGGTVIKLGETKIAETGLETGGPNLPDNFEFLGSEFYSLGTDSEYYKNILDNFSSDLERNDFYRSIRDVAADDRIYNNVKNLDPFISSLSRGIRNTLIEGNFRRLTQGISEPKDFSFSFVPNESCKLEFNIDPSRKPVPTNVHAIVGRNGVGKSTLLKDLLISIKDEDASKFITGEGVWAGIEKIHDFFSNILFFSYSIFDEKPDIKSNYSKEGMSFIPITYSSTLLSICKEKYPDMDFNEYYDAKINRLKFINEAGECVSPEEISNQDTIEAKDGTDIRITEKTEEVEKVKRPNPWTWIFMDSLLNCLERKPILWTKMMRILYSDPIFSELDCISLVSNFLEQESNEYLRTFYNFFEKLSSGHKIVMLSLTRMIELAEEKVLVIIDEPELYLHPPLLSSFIRCLSELMIQRNGVAILATHSPVVLQELQSTTVHKISRIGSTLIAERPEVETFGQSISSLMTEVFSLETEKSGFITVIDNIIKGSVSEERTLDTYLDYFGSLGKSLLVNKLLNKRNGVVSEEYDYSD